MSVSPASSQPILHFADIFEALADAVPGDPALACGDQRHTWGGYDDAAARFATFLAAHGVGFDAKVALYLYNSTEYLIAHFGAMKQRAVPINVNYRYLDDELAYLLDDADAEILVYHASLADRVARIRERSPRIKAFVEVDDLGPDAGRRVPAAAPVLPGALGWDDVIAGHDPAPRIDRSIEDVYIHYTGGTTGMPKGVMYRHADIVGRMFSGYTYRGWTPPTNGAEIVAKSLEHRAEGARRVSIPACPLMHATGLWLGSMYIHLMAGTTVLLTARHYDPAHLLRTAQAERADAMVIVGDAFAKPLLAELDAAEQRGEPYRLDDLRMIISSGVMWSAETQRGILRHLDIRLVDGFGSTEIGLGRRVVTRADDVETARFQVLGTTKLFTEDWREVAAGSGELGRIAGSSYVPLGYYKDPAKTAASFPTVDGVRYAMTGDWARLNDDGTVVLFGRGSNCINTGGEKVFPEEVEEAVKTHPSVADCLVVGVPDERFGQRVVAVAALRPGTTATEDELVAHAKTKLSHYKAPRRVAIVDQVRRAPNGKADYAWAKDAATAG